MRLLLTAFLFLLTGCATKYMLPGNRFLTPESQGEAFRGQIEVQKTTGNELSIDTTNNTIDDGVLYSEVSRTGFLLSNSLFNQLDLYWSHVAGANSMLGGKFQFMGGSRVSKATGHKLAIAAAIGSNEHETDDGVVEFTLGGQEYLILYGYRFIPEFLLYSSVAQANYQFDGIIHSSGALDGLRPKISSRVMSMSAGMEASVDPVFAKLEFTYQSISSDKTSAYTHFITGLSIGYAW
ncbi:MAG: hypothetical protein V4598_16250 [Bdellovibrionota bacterium]